MRALFATTVYSSTLTVPLERVFLDEPATPVHHLLSSRLGSGQFSQPMLDNQNLAYTGPVWVGTPL